MKRREFIAGFAGKIVATLGAAFGYLEGRDFAMEWRFAAGQFDRLPALAPRLWSQSRTG
jgi:hypothetical protein